MAKKYVGYACQHKGSCAYSKFCKIYATKTSAEKKEKGCYRNPDNKMCGSCVHFVETQRIGMYEGQEVSLQPDFHCEIKPECMIIHEIDGNETINYHYERDCKYYHCNEDDDYYINQEQTII